MLGNTIPLLYSAEITSPFLYPMKYNRFTCFVRIRVHTIKRTRFHVHTIKRTEHDHIPWSECIKSDYTYLFNNIKHLSYFYMSIIQVQNTCLYHFYAEFRLVHRCFLAIVNTLLYSLGLFLKKNSSVWFNYKATVQLQQFRAKISRLIERHWLMVLRNYHQIKRYCYATDLLIPTHRL